MRAVIEGYDWGPGVRGVILDLGQAVKPEGITAACFAPVEETRETVDYTNITGPHRVEKNLRPVTDAFLCAEDGRRVGGPSRYLCLAMDCSPTTGAPFCYDFVGGHNHWCCPYELKAALNTGAALETVSGEKLTALPEQGPIDHAQAVVLQMEPFANDSFTGTDGRTLQYAYYAPEGEKLPLFIWLHGAGEGGNDPAITLLGNKVTPLAEEPFQKALGGAAYVLCPQTETFWLQYKEDGSWQDNPGTASIFTHTLKEFLDAFVAAHPAIDRDRILVGGCSNGGYMTLNMVLEYPDFFAAAVPICEAYRDSGISDAQLERVKQVPLWFIYAENDTIVPPDAFEVPTLARLHRMGADIHTSIFPDVHDTSGKYNGPDGKPWQYLGHWSWLYFFNNECTDDATGENLWDWLGKQHR